MKYWFTADNHLGHRNILDYCDRPFDNIKEHDQAQLDGINSLVQPHDWLVIGGDFTMVEDPARTQRYRDLIRCRNVILVTGDHGTKKGALPEGCFQKVEDLLRLSLRYKGTMDRGRQLIVVCHYPMLRWPLSHYGSWNLHGHCHGNLPEDPEALRCDVGVDCWGYKPVSIDTIREKMASKDFTPIRRRKR